ncbi:RNA-binding protein 28-like [Solanum pennellii]|uniref:RNA-binding protein 28-like n=1 Tax=Solanum pennellii TaxID=28526 RepID=A0ABM1HL51_SOLPN|nr:RNA-binding protein 28-like [Solanum pennellii]
MDIEKMFLNSYSIEKKPDICELIEGEAAILVGASKYPVEFEKRKNRIFNLIKYPGEHDIDEEDNAISIDDNDDDNDDNEEEDDVTSVEDPEKEEEDGLATQQVTAESNKPMVTKLRIVISKSVQVALEKQNNNNPITESGTELKKTDLVQQLDKQGTPQSHNTTTMESRKRMKESTKRVQVAPLRVRLLSDLSFQKHLDRGKQLQKQSPKGFKKTDSDTEKKREDGARQTPIQSRRKECTTGSTKSMLPPLMKMNVEVAPPPHPKQRNCSSSTRPMQKISESSAVARPMQIETQSDSDMKKKFESSKRKFEQRLADQREAKRRIITIHFHQMPKLLMPLLPSVVGLGKGFEIMIMRVVGNFCSYFFFL